MKLAMTLPAAILAIVIGTGAAWAQSAPDEPLGRNQDEGQLLPDQAEEVAPLEETIDQDTTPDGPPATTGSIGPADDDEYPGDDSLSGQVMEQEKELYDGQ